MKTLNEILIHTTPAGNTCSGGMALGNELKAEAIKWIKKLNKEEMTLEFAVIYGIKPFQLNYLNNAWKAEKKFTIGWIKHFFCISEEDLK